MDDRKDFKTVLLRGLDENQDLVNTINDVMKQYGINTGQNAIFEIIRRYEILKSQNENLKEQLSNRDSKIRYLQRDLSNHTDTLNKIKEVFTYVNEM
ncbi:hypothetical protein [Flectobacillus roseus]|uniref:hypothetical protein n=1 Tax=Flectobacillus roseus TaxID=502259 RepID=UPI0024B74734|nr:hypothetical protein [Flectobacillus roseus]MDI9872246.1 hypothetical protein [Flectobacillus roseus]